MKMRRRGRHSQRSATLGRLVIVGVDRKTGGVHAHQVKCKGSGDPWIATRIATDIEELGCGASRVALKADQEVAIADVQRQAVAVRSGETAFAQPRGRIAGQRQSRERSSKSARPDQNAERRVGKEIEYGNLVKRHDNPVDG